MCDLDLEELSAVVRVVSQCAVIAGNHVPLMVTDVPQFSLLRETGLAIEYIPHRANWEKHRGDVNWDTFHHSRLAELIRVHQPERVYFVDDPARITVPFLLMVNAVPGSAAGANAECGIRSGAP